MPFIVNNTFGHCGGISEVNAGGLDSSKQGTAAVTQDGYITSSDDETKIQVRGGVKGFASTCNYHKDLVKKDPDTKGVIIPSSKKAGAVP